MLDRLTSGYARDSAKLTGAETRSEIVVNDVSDSGAAIAWTPVADARSYEVKRASDGETGFSSIGSVSGSSFGDLGLHPSTSYRYKVTVTLGSGAEGPSSPV